MRAINLRKKDLREANQLLKINVNGVPLLVKNAAHIHGLAAGFKHGEIIIEGNAGDYLGVLNDGAKIFVRGSTGKYLGDNMTRGTIIVDGDADYGPGQYCYGGTVVIRGNTGDFTGTMNKGATIIVGGNVGNDAGTYMLKGDIIVVGNAGKNFANYLIRGTIYIGGTWESLGHNTTLEEISQPEISRLKQYFETYHIDANPNQFCKIVAASEKPFYH